MSEGVKIIRLFNNENINMFLEFLRIGRFLAGVRKLITMCEGIDENR